MTDDLWSYLPLTDLSYQILLAVAGTPMHGYGLLKAIEDRRAGRSRPDAGTLYTALRRLRDDGLLDAEPAPEGRRTRTYHLTPRGQRILEMESRRLAALVAEARAKKLIPPTEQPA